MSPILPTLFMSTSGGTRDGGSALASSFAPTNWDSISRDCTTIAVLDSFGWENLLLHEISFHSVFVRALPDEGVSLAVLQDHHLNLSGQFASAWGNERFLPPHPVVEYMARNHDAGWQEDDWAPQRDPATSIPYHIMDVPPPRLVEIHRRSIRRNYAFHPYAGILGAMHTMGFYTTRLGVSDFLVMDELRAEHGEVLDPLVEECKRLIDDWRHKLAGDLEYGPLVEEQPLLANYKLLQVFDTMSLFFCLGREGEGKPVTFPNVPGRDGVSTGVTFTPHADGAVEVDPYPFSSAQVSVVLDAKVIRAPFPDDMGDGLRAAPVRQTRFELVEAA
jgi:hypothetical protein